MNFEQALKLIVQHKDRAKARDAHYKAIEGHRDHRRRSQRDERNNQWRVRHNQQRFAHQSQLAEQRDIAQMQRDQYQADQERQNQEAEERRMIDNINSEIDAIENNPGISEEEKRDLTYRLRQKKMGLTPSSPPDQPNYPPEKGIGMTWMEETEDVWPPGHPREGQKIKVWYTRDNRHQVSVVRHEGDKWHEQEDARKKTDAQTAKEEREARQEKRDNWEKKSTDALTALLTHRDTTAEEREEIQWILEQRKKDDKKEQDTINKSNANEAKKADADRERKFERKASSKARSQVQAMKARWRQTGEIPNFGSGVFVGEEGFIYEKVIVGKDEDKKDYEPDWKEVYETLKEIEMNNLEDAYEAEEEEEYGEQASQPFPGDTQMASSEIPTNPETGMLEIV